MSWMGWRLVNVHLRHKIEYTFSGIMRHIMLCHIGVSKNSGTPKWLVKIMEHPIKMGWFGGKTHYFRKHPYATVVFFNEVLEVWSGLGNCLNCAADSTLKLERKLFFYKTSDKKRYCNTDVLGGGFKYVLIFTLTWGDDPIWLNFQMGWNRQLVM